MFVAGVHRSDFKTLSNIWQRIGQSYMKPHTVVVVGVVLVVGAYQHCSHEGLLYSNPPMEFPHSYPEALHTKRRDRPLLAKDGTKAKEFS
jgi:hypothetical protein